MSAPQISLVFKLIESQSYMSPSWLYLTGHLQGLPTSADSQLWIMPALQILLSGSFLRGRGEAFLPWPLPASSA